MVPVPLSLLVTVIGVIASAAAWVVMATWKLRGRESKLAEREETIDAMEVDFYGDMRANPPMLGVKLRVSRLERFVGSLGVSIDSIPLDDETPTGQFRALGAPPVRSVGDTYREPPPESREPARRHGSGPLRPPLRREEP